MMDAAKNMKLLDSDCNPINLAIDESTSEVDGKYVLAKVRGRFFVPEGKSRNKRYYPKELWEKALKNDTVVQKLKSRTMYGTISHEQAIDDKALLEGKISHIVTALDPATGIGEALILNTPAGQVLNTLARAGCQLFVSSRGYGRCLGTTNEGYSIVDPDSYVLETFDFVINAGFTSASPQLIESLEKLKNGGVAMAHHDTLQLTESLEAAIREKERLEQELQAYRKFGTLSELKKFAELVESTLKRNKEPLSESRKDVNDLLAKIYEKYGEMLEKGTNKGDGKEIQKLEEKFNKEKREAENIIKKLEEKCHNIYTKYQKLKSKRKPKAKIKEDFAIVSKLNVPKNVAIHLAKYMPTESLEALVECIKSQKFANKYVRFNEGAVVDVSDALPYTSRTLADRLMRGHSSFAEAASAHSRDDRHMQDDAKLLESLEKSTKTK